MIQNERQYEVTQKKLVDLQQAYEQAQKQPNAELSARAQRAGLNGMLALMGDLRADLDEYQSLRAGELKALPLASVFEDLPATLVRARIARGWTHNDLAKALGTSEQQVQKDENGGYARASLERLQRVAQVIDVQVAGRARLPRRSRQRFLAITGQAKPNKKPGTAPVG